MQSDRQADEVAADVWRRFDSVYFLMWPGWRSQLESNRWHWSKRWAQRLPVVLVQPELRANQESRAEPEPRLDNVSVLSIEASPSELVDQMAIGLRQAGQLASYMNEHGHRAPLLWFYNPWLSVAYLMVPAAARVFHGTENYFDFEAADADMLDLVRFGVEAGDLVVCCSSGVAQGVLANSDCRDPIIIPNGCEYARYRDPSDPVGDWPERIDDWVKADRRLAVFAGNINLRLDFELMLTIARRHSDVGFIYAGPVDAPHLSAEQQALWRTLQGLPNVRMLGALPPHDLPALYHKCDVGIIPYREDMPMLVDNGFPLKALEMAAAGLPVVSTMMRPLQEVPEAVTVTLGREAFDAALGTSSRQSRSATKACAADRVCHAYDYDLLFDQMLLELGSRLDASDHKDVLDVFRHRIGLDNYTAMLGKFVPPPKAPVLSVSLPPVIAEEAAEWLTRTPASLKRMVPLSIKRRLRRLLTGA